VLKQKLGDCTYCGTNTWLTDDHVPPKNIFPKPRPTNLVTVLSCEVCNQAASKDDEYFRLWLIARENAKGNIARDSLLSSVLRSLKRPQAQGWAANFWSNVRAAERLTPAGLYVGTGNLGTFEGARLDRVLTRITKGLFFHEKGHRLPNDHCVRPICLARLDELELINSEARNATEEFIAALLASSEHNFGQAFRYWWLQSPNGLYRSVWLFEFYGLLEYFCTTAPTDTDPIH